MELDDSAESLPVHVLRDSPGSGTDTGTGRGSRGGIVFLHGFSQNAACAGDFLHMIRGRRRIVAVDLPGHGGQGPPDPPSRIPDLWSVADRVAATVDRSVHIGYSMGGRIALHVALAHPGSVECLVLIGSTAGIDDPAMRSERRQADEDLAVRIGRIGLDAFVEEWLDQPLFRHLPRSARFTEQRRRNSVAGLQWSLRTMGTGAMEPLWDRLDAISCPVLVVAGGQDERYRRLAERLVDAIGHNATMAVVEDVGHSVHLEAPAVTAELISDFLEDTGNPSGSVD